MPYKNQEARKAYNREQMRKARVTRTGNTTEGNTEPTDAVLEAAAAIGKAVKAQKRRDKAKGMTATKTRGMTLPAISDIKTQADVDAKASALMERASSYPPILYALTDPIKRKKLEAICESLDNHKLLSKVYYGAGAYSVDMETVRDLLGATG